MPIRQPCGSSAPACSPADQQRGRAVRLDRLAAGQEPDAAAVARRRRRRRPRGGSARAAAARARPRARNASVSASSRPAGPHAQVWRSRQSGTRRSSSATSQPAGAIVVVLVQRVAAMAGGERAQLARRRSCPRRRGDVHVRGVGKTSRGAARARAASPITGVMPLPAVTNSSGCSTASGSTNSPAGGASRTSMPRRAWRTRCSDTNPPGMRLTVMAMRPSRRPRQRRERVRAPVAHTVDIDADAHVLARHVRGPARGPAAATASRNRVSRPRRLRRGHAARASTTAGSTAPDSRPGAAAW